MTVRSKTPHGALRGRRPSRVSREQDAAASRGNVSAREPQPGATHEAIDRTMCRGGSSQDRALYSCGCGYAFDALVSTSVDCPHCGDRQAW